MRTPRFLKGVGTAMALGSFPSPPTPGSGFFPAQHNRIRPPQLKTVRFFWTLLILTPVIVPTMWS